VSLGRDSLLNIFKTTLFLAALATTGKLRRSYVHLTENSHCTANMHLLESLKRIDGKVVFLTLAGPCIIIQFK
jgi:hypothetical protein